MPPLEATTGMLLAPGRDGIRSLAVAGGMSVLVVEDDASLRLLCRVNLELERFDVREAGTIDEARAEVEAERPGVVFLDVHLRGQETDGLLDEFRAAGIPVVVVTGSADISRFRDRAVEVLEKPFRPADLIAAAKRHGRPLG